MFQELENKVMELQTLYKASEKELTTVLENINKNHKAALHNIRLVLEKILIDIYLIEKGISPKEKNGKFMTIEPLLNGLNDKLDRRMFVRMKTVQNMGNMGSHPQEEDELLNEADVEYALSSLCEIMIWFLYKYQNMSELQEKFKFNPNNINLRSKNFKNHILDNHSTVINNTFSGNIYASVNAGIENFMLKEEENQAPPKASEAEGGKADKSGEQSESTNNTESNQSTSTTQNSKAASEKSDSKVINIADGTKKTDDADKVYSQRHVSAPYIVNNFNGILNGPINSGMGSPLNLDSETRRNGITMYTLNNKTIDKIKNVYIETPDYTNINAFLKEHNLVFLFSSEHSGKYTTAIHLLLEKEIDSLHHVFLDGDLMSFEKADIKENYGYIIDKLPYEKFSELNEFNMKYLDDLLRARNSYLVVTLHYNNISQNEFCLHCSPQINKFEILLNHLQYFSFEGSNDKLDLIMDKFTLSTINFVRNNILISEIEKIVVKLLNSSNQIISDNFDEILKGNVVASVKDEVKSWFSKHHANEDLSFYIAMAVFEGTSLEIIKTMSTTLKEYINQYLEYDVASATSTNEISYKDKLFTRTVSDRLADAGASVMIEKKDTEIGRLEMECVKFNSDIKASVIIEYIWKEFDEFRLPFLQWLRNAGEIYDEEVSSSVAKTVSMLCRFDFSTVYNHVISEWAEDEKAWIRMSAVYSLDLLCIVPGFLEPVSKLITSWIRGNDKELIKTAIYCYGNNLGFLKLDQALEDLTNITERTGYKELPVIYDTLSDMFINRIKAGSQYDRILHILYKWMNPIIKDKSNKTKEFLDKQKYSANKALYIFLRLSRYIYFKSNNKQIPVLVDLLADRKFKNNYISRFMIISLNSSFSRDFAYETIGWWFSSCEDTQYAVNVEKWFVEMLLSGNSNERNRLYYCLDYCARNKKINSKSARRLLKEYFNN